MNPRLRLWIVCIVAGFLGIATASSLAEESYLMAGLLGFLILWVVCEWLHGPLPDACVLGLVAAGYIIGNRGFAQFSVTPTFPLLPAEAALLICVPALVLRWAFKQSRLGNADGLNFAILIWIGLGVARLPIDLKRHGVLALRDFAMVYYATFFFVAQALCLHEGSRRFLRRAFGVGFAILPFVSVAFLFAPEFFLGTLTVRGVPLIYLKGDLAAGYLASGFFLFWSWYELRGLRWWLIPAGFCLLMSPNVGSPRSAMVGTLMVTVAWLLARRIRLLGFQIGLVTVTLMAALPVIVITQRDFKETPIYSIYEHALSILDFQGTGQYRHAETGDPGDNNRFRLVWWKSVTEDTLENGPIFGLGFGADLASRFLVEYDLIEAEDFNARSPHSIVMTTFGRMGAIGLVGFIAIAVMMVRYTVPVFLRRDYETMGMWSVAWVMWFSACFGVVLEGPMGAVIFWTALGIAHHSTQRLLKEPEAVEVPTAPIESESEAVPVMLRAPGARSGR